MCVCVCVCVCVCACVRVCVRHGCSMLLILAGAHGEEGGGVGGRKILGGVAMSGAYSPSSRTPPIAADKSRNEGPLAEQGHGQVRRSI